jgi:poly-gamma-glutamate synthesis protein (capsule biosynthesis protein)
MRPLAALLALALLASACGGGAGAPSPGTQAATAGNTATPGPAAESPAGSPSPAPEAEATLLAAGDVMLGRSIGDGIREHGPAWPFERVADVLRAADVAFVNLESPLTDGGQPADKDFIFRGPPEAAGGLAGAGVDIVSLANNHVFDYGFTGLQDTWAALNAAGVAHAGSGENIVTAQRPVVIERNGLKLAFLAFVSTPPDSGSGFDVSATAASVDRPGVAWLTPETVAEDVAAAKAQADLVVVSLHTGAEYQEPPTELQTEAAHAAIDAGAALVLGSHPHVLQGIETYKGGLIVYSLGNLVFDFDFVDYSYPGLPSALSALLRVELGKTGVVKCELAPVLIGEADGRPRLVSGAEAAPVLERMRRLSDGSCGL